MTTCEGQTVKPDLDTQALAHIERRQNHSSIEVSVAWLEAPEGSQLLLVANEDFCTWQPTEKASEPTSGSSPYDRGLRRRSLVPYPHREKYPPALMRDRT